MLEESSFSLQTLVGNLIEENKPAAAEKKINPSLKSSGDPLTMHADGGEIGRVIGELIGNAIKYTPKGGSVDAGLEKVDDAISFSVKDSGIGMTKEECEEIWDRFFRTVASQEFAKGSGLGLSIAKELIEMHGGTLAVESRPGEGATFTMTLPSGTG